MYVLICKRVVKVNTGAVEKFAPRSANQTRYYVSGPFASIRMAQRAAVTALGTHTCLEAQAWTAEQVEAEHAKGYGQLGSDRMNMMDEAKRLLAAAQQTV